MTPIQLLFQLALFVLVSVTSTCPTNAQNGSTSDTKGIEKVLRQRLEKRFEELPSPGAVVGVYAGDDAKPILEMALGVADVRAKTPLKLEHHMRIASLTKLFVGTAVLVER